MSYLGAKASPLPSAVYRKEGTAWTIMRGDPSTMVVGLAQNKGYRGNTVAGGLRFLVAYWGRQGYLIRVETDEGEDTEAEIFIRALLDLKILGAMPSA